MVEQERRILANKLTLLSTLLVVATEKIFSIDLHTGMAHFTLMPLCNDLGSGGNRNIGRIPVSWDT